MAALSHGQGLPLRRAIEESGVLNYQKGLSSLARAGHSELVELIRGGESQFAMRRSGISATYAEPTKNSQVVCVDIGGTNVRVSVRRIDADGNITWHPLLNQPHAELCGNKAVTFDTFAATLAETVAEKMKTIGASTHAKNAVVVTWSNSFEPEQLPKDGKVTGVSGVASKVKELYTKGELFLEGVVDGTPLGTILSTAFQGAGIPLDTFVLGNDTVFTLKAGTGAHAGVIVSTGINGTFVVNGEVINGETGGGFKVPESMLGLPDKRFGKEVSVQDLVSGGFLPDVFKRYICEFAGRNVDGFGELHHHNRIFKDRVKAEGISALADGSRDGFSSNAPFPTKDFSEATWLGLTRLAELLTDRAADLSAVLALTSVQNRIATESGPHVIALDSSMARGSPRFFSRFCDTLGKLAYPSQIAVDLLYPEGDIPVPTRGAAKTLDTIWAAQIPA
jgi:hypothetical protein